MTRPCSIVLSELLFVEIVIKLKLSLLYKYPTHSTWYILHPMLVTWLRLWGCASVFGIHFILALIWTSWSFTFNVSRLLRSAMGCPRIRIIHGRGVGVGATKTVRHRILSFISRTIGGWIGGSAFILGFIITYLIYCPYRKHLQV